MDLIKEIEEMRMRKGLTPTEMASEFGVIYQNYNNWVARNSLPKHFYERAQELLFDEKLKNDKEIKAYSIFSKLSPEGQQAALRSIEAIYDLDQRS